MNFKKELKSNQKIILLAQDVQQMAAIIAKYKTKLSNENIKQLLLIASDINQMAQLIG